MARAGAFASLKRGAHCDLKGEDGARGRGFSAKLWGQPDVGSAGSGGACTVAQAGRRVSKVLVALPGSGDEARHCLQGIMLVVAKVLLATYGLAGCLQCLMQLHLSEVCGNFKPVS